MNSRKYQKPKITAVTLDPKQAVLAVCEGVSGIWMIAAGNACIMGTTGSLGCNTGQRGPSIGETSSFDPSSPGS